MKKPRAITRHLPGGATQSARTVRGPRADGRYYWRADRCARGQTMTDGCKWLLPTEVEDWLRELTPRAERRRRGEAPEVEQTLTLWPSSPLRDLLRGYCGAVVEPSPSTVTTLRPAIASRPSAQA